MREIAVENLHKYVPKDILKAFEQWVEEGKIQQPVVMRMLENDLWGVIRHMPKVKGDIYPYLDAVMQYIHYALPKECHGSKAQCRKWAEHKQEGYPITNLVRVQLNVHQYVDEDSVEDLLDAEEQIIEEIMDAAEMGREALEEFLEIEEAPDAFHSECAYYGREEEEVEYD